MVNRTSQITQSLAGIRVRILIDNGYPDVACLGISQSASTNAGIMPKTGHDDFFPIPRAQSRYYADCAANN
jgi:hypothetical protein